MWRSSWLPWQEKTNIRQVVRVISFWQLLLIFVIAITTSLTEAEHLEENYNEKSVNSTIGGRNLSTSISKYGKFGNSKYKLNKTHFLDKDIISGKFDYSKYVPIETHFRLDKSEDPIIVLNKTDLFSDVNTLDKLENSKNITKESYILSDAQNATNETHILSDAQNVTNETHILSDAQNVTNETHILNDAQNVTNEAHLLSDVIRLDKLDNTQNITNESHLLSDDIRVHELEKTQNNETYLLNNGNPSNINNETIHLPKEDPTMLLVGFASTTTRSDIYQYNSTQGTMDHENPSSSLWKIIKEEVAEILKGNEYCLSWKFTCLKNATFDHPFLPSNKTHTQLCECDSKCRAYGDCCMDLASSLTEPQVIKQPPKQLFCGALDFWSKKSLHGILMVGHCPPSASGSEKEWLCLQKVPEESYTFILDVPVTSSKTNLTYRNYYCAQCNNDADQLVELNFNISETCTSKQDTRLLTFNELMEKSNTTFNYKLSKNYQSDFMTNDDKMKPLRNQPCILRVKEYSDVNKFAALYYSRICGYPESSNKKDIQSEKSKAIKQVRFCNPKWDVSSDFQKCDMYSLHVIDLTDNTVYKNPHCAKCNGVNVFSHNISCTLRAATKKKGPNAPNLSALFEVKKSENCPNRNEIWDTWRDKCSPILCEESYIVWWGKKCVKVFTSDEGIRVDPYSETTCPRIALNEGDYNFYKNGSVFSVLNKKVYGEEEFQIFNGSTVLICAEQEVSYTHSYITYTVVLISLICLSIHIFIYLYFSSRRTWQRRNLFCLCCSLFVAQLLFLIGTAVTDYHGFCFVLSVCLHFFWLVSFCWMNILSIDVWRSFRNHMNHNSMSKSKIFLIYNIYAWGIPFFIVLAALILDLAKTIPHYRPRYASFYSKRLCWINNPKGLVLFFIFPVGFLVIQNFVFFIMTSYGIYKQLKAARSESVQGRKVTDLSSPEKTASVKIKHHERTKVRLSIYVKLGILQGLTWMIVFVSAFVSSPVLSHAFTIVNGLQGAAILITFDLKKWVFHSIRKKVTEISLGSKNSKTISSKSDDKKENSNMEESDLSDDEDIEKKGSNSQQQDQDANKSQTAEGGPMNAVPVVSSAATLPSYTSREIASEINAAVNNSQEYPKSKESKQNHKSNIHNATIEPVQEKNRKKERKNHRAADDVRAKKDKTQKSADLPSARFNPSFVSDENVL